MSLCLLARAFFVNFGSDGSFRSVVSLASKVNAWIQKLSVINLRRLKAGILPKLGSLFHLNWLNIVALGMSNFHSLQIFLCQSSSPTRRDDSFILF